jgi:hypothetical protein
VYVTIAIHHAKGPAEESILLDAMKRFGQAQRRRGSIIVTAGKDDIAGFIFALAIWDSKENFQAAQGEMGKALQGVNFEVLEDIPHKLYLGEPSVWV